MYASHHKAAEYRNHCQSSRFLIARFLFAGIGAWAVLGGLVGCQRDSHFRAADRDAYGLIQQKAHAPTWQIGPDFDVQPDTRSRFFDPTNPVDPQLPMPAPQLYNYQLPPLQTPAAKTPQLDGAQAPGIGSAEQSSSSSVGELTPPQPADAQVVGAAYTQESVVTLAAPLMQSEPQALELPPPSVVGEPSVESLPAPPAESSEEEGATRINPIPKESWEALPEACLRRMLEFETVRQEFERTYQTAVSASQLDSAERLTLANILEVSLVNNRDYQTRKETLYRVALRLSLRRFDYNLKFLPSGNGTDATYIHDRTGGIEVNRLATPTDIGISKSLYTAGDLVARFANDVVLTFNGSSGYSSSVGSSLLIDLAQPIMQRDVRFEPLTQAERDVVYAARDFVRYRKQMFRDLAVQYYNLLLTYRSIAINTQDYFSNLRGFNRTAALEQVGSLPRFQVDQFEQNALRSRGNLISSCNNLEGALDRLKLRIGLPTEMPVNLDLSELEELTQRDESTVIQEQIRRKVDYVYQQQQREGAESALTAAAEVARRTLNLANLQVQMGSADESVVQELEMLVTRLDVEGLRIVNAVQVGLLEHVDENQEEQVYSRLSDAVSAPLASFHLQLALLDQVLRSNQLEDFTVRNELAERLKSLDDRLADVFERRKRIRQTQELFAFYPAVIAELRELRSEVIRMESDFEQALLQHGVQLATSVEDLEGLTQQVVARVQTPQFMESAGLIPVEVDVDEAMLTALVQRLDLMNRRGEVADAWREIKYSGDDLRSVLNIRATQSIRTRLGSKNPFDFSLDDSTTTLGMDFDTPLNRRAERNAFRLALIDYNAALRRLIEAQDNVKLDIRNDLRSLELDRNQYEIAIASAALAYERVVSTRLQLNLAVKSVTARDFLEAQQAYTQSLSAVAQQHIGYIIDRIEFFLDLEQLQVDDLNFWPQLRDDKYPFVPNVDFNRTSPAGYGTLPPGPWYSRKMERMRCVPNGLPAIHKAAENDVD
ncbi:TolC family protein [Aureliella helgolandensis]|uniref:Outer membrane efflux protein n=1 Tax=Aureliella helgolandensis TaxID=2527968 RepID=A0A518G6W7_9BACT|nr:TolC family protein [Aureliella helgolandensis]QDV24333.1 Outer membrane efflux protein [Aureliella helgolandensis]